MTEALLPRTSLALPGPQSPALLNVLEYGLWPRRFALRCAEHYGRVYRVAALGKTFVCTTEPAHIRRVFGADPSIFRSFSERSLRNFFGPRSVLLTAGKEHTQQRKLLSPPLSGAKLRAFGATMEVIAQEHIERLRPGQQLRALDLTTAFTLDVIVRTVFGASRGDDASTLKQLLAALIHAVPPLAIFTPKLQQTWFPPWARYERVRQRARSWVEQEIARRRRDQTRKDDVLSLLLEARHEDGSEMDQDEIIDQLLTLLVAGHETTALTLATCLNRLHSHPEVLEELRLELTKAQSTEALQRAPFLSAVIDECLRIDPIVPDVARVPNVDFRLEDDLVITPDEVLVILIEALHHDPLLYPEPERFSPARFLGQRPSPFEYAPFGGGVRRCLGAAFSDYETKIFLGRLLQQTDLALLRRTPEPRVRRNITMGPKYGVPLRVQGVRPGLGAVT